jgi:hypothetical protein
MVGRSPAGRIIYTQIANLWSHPSRFGAPGAFDGADAALVAADPGDPGMRAIGSRSVRGSCERWRCRGRRSGGR